MKPVVIIVGGSALDTWTDMTLQRSKDEMTGQLSVSVFAGAVPSKPMLAAIRAGCEIQVYIGGQLAFTGSVDSRTGTGDKKGKQGTDSNKDNKGSGGGGKASTSVSIGPNEYTVKISARGKTRRLIDSSHQHPTTNMMKPTTKQAVDKLVEPFKVPVEFLGKVIKLDKLRFRDGARVVDELHRIGTENCYFMYETRDGKLRVTDGVGTGSGDPIILGQNILTFSAEQSDDEQRSDIKVKGQRSKKEEWGEKAVLKTHKKVRNQSGTDFSPTTVPHYGDATDEALERRARFEANKRNSASKKITVEVFHVQTPSGQPWDIGATHYVEVPPEGIFDVFECTELTYTVNAEKELKTKLTLAPPPSGGAGGMAGGFGLSGLTGLITQGLSRRAASGIALAPDSYPAPWSPPMLAEMPLMTLVEEAAKLVQPVQEAFIKPPPLTLPPWFEDAEEQTAVINFDDEYDIRRTG